MKKSDRRRGRVFDEAFKRMAIDLSHAKGSVREGTRELRIDSSRITKWRQTHKSPGQRTTSASGLSQEQQRTRRLQKELKDAEFEQDILKKAATVRRTASSLWETGNIPIYSGSCPPVFG